MSQKSYIASVPSNIAFLKYWGKENEAEQWPANDSLSMTLENAKTITNVTIGKNSHRVILNDVEVSSSSSAGKKIFNHLNYLSEKFGFDKPLSIESLNTFPTGCGIASSASGLGALTLGSIAAWTDSSNLEELNEKGFSLPTLANLARMGSGSAARSFAGGYVQWSKGTSPSQQEVCQRFPREHWQLSDLIVLFSSQPKHVSSTTAHKAAWSSPLFPARLASLDTRLSQMTNAIEQRDMGKLGPLMEQEALEMHGVIMSSNPSIQYFDQTTGNFLAWIRQLRKETGLEVYFTIDAGPNIHMIGQPGDISSLKDHIAQTFPELKMIEDITGSGPSLSAKSQ